MKSSGLARSERGPRRPAPATSRRRRPHWAGALPPKRKVVPIGGGKYRVTTEEILTEEQLAEMGLELPPLDLPWNTEPARVVHASERTDALRYWAERLDGYTPRLSNRVVVFIQEFGLAGVKQAIDQVAATNPTGGAEAKYEQLIRVLLETRARRGGAR